MIPLTITEAKVTMPPRGIEVLLKVLMTVMMLLMIVMLMNKVQHLVSNRSKVIGMIMLTPLPPQVLNKGVQAHTSLFS